MNALTFFLISAFICGTVYVAPCHGQLNLPSPLEPGSFLNLTSGLVQLFENNVLELQQYVLSQIRDIFQLVINEICSMLSGMINLFDLPLVGWCQWAQSQPTVNPRDRRSLLPVTNLVPPPIQSLLTNLQSVNLTEIIQNPFDSLTSGIVSEIESAINQTLPIVTTYISTELLPQTRRALDALQRTNRLPPSINTLILNFDLLYNILQSLGYLSPVPS